MENINIISKYYILPLTNKKFNLNLGEKKQFKFIYNFYIHNITFENKGHKIYIIDPYNFISHYKVKDFGVYFYIGNKNNNFEISRL
jgi:hypothetical protein